MLAASRRLQQHSAEVRQLGKLGDFYAGTHALRQRSRCPTRAVTTVPFMVSRPDLRGFGNNHNAQPQRAFEFNPSAFDAARDMGDIYNQGAVMFNASLLTNKLGDRARAIEFSESLVSCAGASRRRRPLDR